ncbi:hypothetical protein B0I35DRAFT_477061 [Stachybotrys elegans]|uniref:Uncharacterized protein n=1 Tax=Stachybotrys elegans TaxID=80388 RepID=A0A8K0WUH4_9HYPO|nr:hypothetical protein B0I35DRAFT_477061 [Stachybotrys elegans]
MSHLLSERDALYESTRRGFVARCFTKPKSLPQNVKFTDKVAVITGSNAGLGFEAARQFLALGLSHLVMGVRSQAKGDAAAASLRKEFPAATVTVWLLDMDSYESVQGFAANVATLPRVDFAILNAGAVKQTFSIVASTGHESSLQANYLSTALLAILLLPVLKAKKSASGVPVLSLVGSDTAYMETVKTQDGILHHFDNPEGYANMQWYGREKQLLALFAANLAELVDPKDVLVHTVNPGLAKGTALGREFPGIVKVGLTVMQNMLGRTPEVGASTYVDAVVNHGAESHGSFLSEWTIKPFPVVYYTKNGPEFVAQLWKETMEELQFAGVTQILESLKSGN